MDPEEQVEARRDRHAGTIEVQSGAHGDDGREVPTESFFSCALQYLILQTLHSPQREDASERDPQRGPVRQRSANHLAHVLITRRYHWLLTIQTSPIHPGNYKEALNWLNN
ncbi:hypothetical protein N7462_003223 [Penicillium macrosclerotiorum]|uniref:uncharacterized protein n=1 Tax=Penicillium macrosclerotiorum TaxID=303699 RepID=UPI002547C1A0|nr:uncharacterized protein N7462_003223 [Penicillium macrosclerotiorum]KAJ5688831.1 hypothetical protein N7462_003223 [Penicillium macrosclerotiorum]